MSEQCQSCGKPWTHHAGIAATCAKAKVYLLREVVKKGFRLEVFEDGSIGIEPLGMGKSILDLNLNPMTEIRIREIAVGEMLARITESQRDRVQKLLERKKP